MKQSSFFDKKRFARVSGVEFLWGTYTWLFSVGVRDDVIDLLLWSNRVTFTR